MSESSLASSNSTDEKKEGEDDSPERKAQLEADRRKELERIRSFLFAERLPASTSNPSVGAGEGQAIR